MKRPGRFILKTILFLGIFPFKAQVNLDSLKQEYSKLPNDTHSVFNILRFVETERKKDLTVANAAVNIALERARQLKDKKALLFSNYYAGSVSCLLSDFEAASGYLNNAQKIAEEVNNKEMLLRVKVTVGNMYSYNKQTKKAREIYLELLKTSEVQGNEGNIATVYNNLGAITYRESNLEKSEVLKAARYFVQAVKILETTKNKPDLASKYCNLGLVYCDAGMNDTALYYLAKAKEVIDKEKLPDDLIIYYSYLGRVYTDIKQYDESEKYYLLSIAESRKLNSPDWVREGYLSLSDMYEGKGDFKKALEYARKYHYLNDSITNEANFSKAADIQNKFEREKKESELNALKAQQSKNRIFNWALIIVSLLLVVSGLMMYSRFKIKAESEKKLKVQNEIIVQKNKDITDSINYSQKIQEAILPSDQNVRELFPQSFVLYKPKDIISGDFYWCVKANNLKFIAVADCTGHGVPGALMSILGTSLLKEIVVTRGITDTGKILDNLREMVIESLGQSSGNRKDGMDIALICYDEKEKKVNFSGANNTAVIIKNGVISELLPNKQPVGQFERQENFTRQEILIDSQTFVYLYSDGYPDQFGGPKGKKFKYKPLNEMLLRNHQLNFDEQGKLLNDAFNDWKGDLEQVDDVCVVGIKLG